MEVNTLQKADSRLQQFYVQLSELQKQKERIEKEFVEYKLEEISIFCQNHSKFTGTCQELLQHFQNKDRILVKWGKALMVFNDPTLKEAEVPPYCSRYAMEVSDEKLLFSECSAAPSGTSYTFSKKGDGFSLSYGFNGGHTFETDIFITDDYHDLIKDVGYFPTHNFHKLVDKFM